jgi:hypothetical protein
MSQNWKYPEVEPLDPATEEALVSMANERGYKTWEDLVTAVVKANANNTVPKGISDPGEANGILEIDMKTRGRGQM